MNATLRALNGFGLGARPGERRRIGDPRAWLRAQLQRGRACVCAPRPKRPPTPSAMPFARFRMARASAADEQARQQARRRARGDRGRRKPRGAHRARDDRAAVRRAAGRVLVEPSVRVGRREGAGRAAGRQLRARGHPAARARPLRGHGARVGEASGDARLPRQLPVDRPGLARRAQAGARARASGAGSTRTTRASCSSCTRSASTAATRSRTSRSSRRS